MENKTLAVALDRKQVHELVNTLQSARQELDESLLPLLNELLEYQSFGFIPEGYVLLTNATDCDIQRIRRVRVSK